MSNQSKNIERIIRNTLNQFDLEAEYRVEDDYVFASTAINIPEMDIDFAISFEVFDGGLLMFRAASGHVITNDRMHEMINRFNVNNLYFKAFVGDKFFVEVQKGVVLEANMENDLEQQILFILREFPNAILTEEFAAIVEKMSWY